ncbi:hypothetical protein AMJ52_09140 [candidate division TA06 bacterium DG_78]|uniref:Uncharacterized protein n=1 Tax=candidate division TA06 bacterium DG_78 TaxID=1703772 RepID=A0A0S7Y994_UNCT6|nr:MAG: hypothetical protein AMJ52_09140 [candidate division TA06 bacterium DG_78]
MSVQLLAMAPQKKKSKKKKTKTKEEPEPTIECPNCGALVPLDMIACFVCDKNMPTKVSEEVVKEDVEIGEIPPSPMVSTEEPSRAEEEIDEISLLDEVEAIGDAQPLRVTHLEIEPKRTYKGLLVTATGGLIYSLILLVFIPILGNIISSIFLALCAILIVFGGNMTVKDIIQNRPKKEQVICPLCNLELDSHATECFNCGAIFIKKG